MEQLAEMFKALGDPTRLRILALLAQRGEICVCEIVPEIGAPQSTVSHHLAALRHAGLVRQRRESQKLFYRLTVGRHVREAVELLETLQERAGRESSGVGV